MGIFLEEHVHMLPLAITTVGYFQVHIFNLLQIVCLQKSSPLVHIAMFWVA